MSTFAFVVIGTQVDGQSKQILSSWPAGAFADKAVASHFASVLNNAVSNFRAGKVDFLTVQELDPSYTGEGTTHYQVFETKYNGEDALHAARRLYDVATGAGEEPLVALEQVSSAYGRATANHLLRSGLQTP